MATFALCNTVTLIPHIRNSNYGVVCWGYVGASGIGDRAIRALRGKALGGSSAVNAAVAMCVFR
jgi:hypothetical protein